MQCNGSCRLKFALGKQDCIFGLNEFVWCFLAYIGFKIYDDNDDVIPGLCRM